MYEENEDLKTYIDEKPTSFKKSENSPVPEKFNEEKKNFPINSAYIENIIIDVPKEVDNLTERSVTILDTRETLFKDVS